MRGKGHGSNRQACVKQDEGLPCPLVSVTIPPTPNDNKGMGVIKVLFKV